MSLSREDIKANKITKRDMLRFLHSHGDTDFLSKHKCNGRISNLRTQRSCDELSAAVLELLPKAKSHVKIQKSFKLTPIKKRVLGERNMNTPPMTKVLKQSQSILAASHATQNNANHLLKQIENSPSFKTMPSKQRVVKQHSKKVCTPPMKRILREVDTMLETAHTSEKTSFALETDLQVLTPTVSTTELLTKSNPQKISAEYSSKTQLAAEPEPIMAECEVVTKCDVLDSVEDNQEPSVMTRRKKARRNKGKELKAQKVTVVQEETIVTELQNQSFFFNWFWGKSVAYRMGVFSTAALISGLTFQIGSRLLTMYAMHT